MKIFVPGRICLFGEHSDWAGGSNGAVSCARQVVDAYQQSGTSVVGLRRTAEAEIAGFGAATGVWINPERRLNVTEFAEKPTVDYARSHLRVPGLPEGEYLTVFGQYVIKPPLFNYLEEQSGTTSGNGASSNSPPPWIGCGRRTASRA